MEGKAENLIYRVGVAEFRIQSDSEIIKTWFYKERQKTDCQYDALFIDVVNNREHD